MVDFFGNSSETHVKLDMKAIAKTTRKSSFQEYQRILKRESIIEESISMPQKLLCPQCDAEISENFKFCKNCGFNLQNLN